MKLYLIRHAQSLNNARPQEQRVEDPSLTEVGHEQATKLAEWIPSLNLTRLITSPFLRSLQTAEPIGQSTSLVPEVRIELHEEGGCYRGHTPENITGRPGMNRAEIERQFPSFNITASLDGDGWWASKPYETRELARRRASALLELTRDEFAGTSERVAYVMHADIKLLLLGQFHSGPLETPCNTSVTTVEITPDSIRLDDFNRVEHLPAEFVTR